MISRQTANSKLLAKAAQDPQFRAQLVADPRAAIEKEFGVKVPAAAQITVLEEKPDQYYMVLPVNPEKGKLGATELDAVAAGGCYGDCDHCGYDIP